MSAKAVVVPGVTYYECKLAGLIGLCNNNPDGYYLYPTQFSPQNTYLVITANGYKSYIQPVTLNDQNQQFIVGGSSTNPNDVNLPPLSFSKPSRDRIINVMANLCNINDATGLPIFEPFISTLFYQDRPRANDWITRLKDNGSTHITVEITGDYDEYLPWLGGRYPIVGMDFTSNIDAFKKFLDWILSTNLIPIVKSGCDGQAYQAGGKTYGWSWGMANMPAIYYRLADYMDYCLQSTGYDGCFPDWSPTQLLDFLRMMLASGCKYIDTEFGSGPGESISYTHLGQGAANWVPDQLGMLDSFSIELQTNPAVGEGMIEVYDRLLNEASPVYYRHAVTKTQNIGMYETTAYWSIRKDASQSPQSVAKQAYDIGYRSFGNGLPL